MSKAYSAKEDRIILPLKVLHVVGTVVLFSVGWWYWYLTYPLSFQEKYNFVIIAIYSASFIYLNHTFEGYRVSFSKPKKLIFSQSLATLLSLFFIYVGTASVWFTLRSPDVLFFILIAQIAFNGIWSYGADALYYHRYKPLETLVVYGDKKDLERLSEIERFTRKFHIREVLSAKDPALIEKASVADAVFLLGGGKGIRDKIGLMGLQKQVLVFGTQDLEDVTHLATLHVQSFGTPLLMYTQPAPSFLYLSVKRCLDFSLALPMLICVSPILLCAAIAILVKDPGPVLFKQLRMGQHMQPFTCYKLRTMSVKAPSQVAAQNIDAKHYLSPIGKFLRSTSIDELPQLFNIVMGDMSFIGPRPVILGEKGVIEKREVLGIYALKPGISGLAQVSGRNEVNDTEKVLFDYEYLRRISFLEDIRIFFLTIAYVLEGRGIFRSR